MHQEIICRRCGVTIPKESLKWKKSRGKNGGMIPETLCSKCYLEAKQGPLLYKRYNVYDGIKLVFSGSCKEIAEEFHVAYSTVCNCVRKDTLLLWRYALDEC